MNEVQTPTYPGNAMTLLIADDNAAMRKAIRNVAARETDTVVECVNGNEAIDAFDRCHPDLVLMDIQMPVMDGIQATKKILEHDPSAHVVVVTEFDNESFRSAATKAGAKAFVSKENLFELSTFIYH